MPTGQVNDNAHRFRVFPRKIALELALIAIGIGFAPWEACPKVAYSS
jgi:hypothetical protein